MTVLDWSKAPEGATHYSEYYGAFVMPYAPGKWLVQSDNGGKVVTFMDVGIFIPRPTKPAAPEWGGEGLPPVGCECEVKYAGYWVRAKVVHLTAIGSLICEMFDEYRGKVRITENPQDFRPLRTKEQRERDGLVQVIKGNRFNFEIAPFGIIEQSKAEDLADAIIAAGWRKGDS